MNNHQNQPYLQNLSTQSVHILSDTIIIGRHQDCNLVLKSERGASRKHARITVQNGNAVLSRAVQLADGDIVIFDEQEYRFTGAAADTQSGSDNVTVIANKDEIGRPDRIKPAIRLVETEPVPIKGEVNIDANDPALDETAAWDSLASKLDDSQSTERTTNPKAASTKNSNAGVVSSRLAATAGIASAGKASIRCANTNTANTGVASANTAR